jgi:hypothetical protein
MVSRHYSITVSRRPDVGSPHDFVGVALHRRGAAMFCRFDGVPLWWRDVMATSFYDGAASQWLHVAVL